MADVWFRPRPPGSARLLERAVLRPRSAPAQRAPNEVRDGRRVLGLARNGPGAGRLMVLQGGACRPAARRGPEPAIP